MKYRLVSLLFLLVFQIATLQAKPKLVASLPFELVGSYIVLEARINNTAPLHLIFDTGVRNTFITELLSEDSIALNYTELKTIQGLGHGITVNAFISDSNTLSLGKFSMNNKTVYVLEDDFLCLSQQIGKKINGLLGIDIIRDYMVHVDYTRKRMRFYKPDTLIPSKKYGYMPMIVENNKLFLSLSILETDTARRKIKMFIDSGAQLSAWFQTLTNKAVNIPERRVRGRIGEGFSGEINGYYARVPQICIAHHCVKNPIVAFPDSSTISRIIAGSDRDGTIGSELLSRFDLFIDIPNKAFYFKPNHHFKKPFKYNIPGIEISQHSLYLPQYEVTHVWKDSPAEKAGILVGDVLVEINNVKVYLMTLEQIRDYFEQSSNKPMKLLLDRENKFVEVKVNMNAKI